jgi:hypothetical protein
MHMYEASNRLWLTTREHSAKLFRRFWHPPYLVLLTHSPCWRAGANGQDNEADSFSALHEAVISGNRER